MWVSNVVRLAVLALLGQQAQHSSACLECYAGEKIEKFPQWTLDNNLDPSPPMDETLRFSESNIFLRLETELKNLTIEGYSNNLRASGIDADFIRGTFSVYFFDLYDVTLTGEHVTNGTVLSQTPLNGEGQWRIRVPYIDIGRSQIEFEMLSTGFFNLTSSSLGSMSIRYLENAEIYFENLSDNEAAVGYEEYLNTALFDGVQRAYNNFGPSNRNPIGSALHKFWQEVLEKTTLSDVIGSTALPPTTPTVPEATYTFRTTQDPCLRPETEKINEPQIVSEEVLETIRGVDENGTPVIYKKRLVVTKEIQNEL